MDQQNLFDAAKTGDIDTIMAVVSIYTEKNSEFHDHMDGALSYAAFYGQMDVVKYLIAEGADPFGANGSALNLALVDNRLEVAAFLQEIMAAEKTDFLAGMNAAADVKIWLRQDYKDTGEVPLVRALKMKCFDDVAEKMIAVGDGLSSEDVVRFREHEGKKSLLKLASGEGQLRDIFNPKLWRGRLQDMKQAFDFIPESDKKLHAELPPALRDIDFDGAVAAYHQMVLKEQRPKSVFKGPRQG